MPSQRTKGFNFPTGAFGNFAENIVRAGQYEGSGIAALLGGVASGISSKREREDRKEKEAKDLAFKRDEMDYRRSRDAKDDARQDAYLSIAQQKLEVEQTKNRASLLEQGEKDLAAAQARIEFLNTMEEALGQPVNPRLRQEAESLVQQLSVGLPGLAAKLKRTPNAQMHLDTPENIGDLEAGVKQNAAYTQIITSQMEAAARRGNPEDVLLIREYKRLLNVAHTKTQEYMARVQSEKDRRAREASAAKQAAANATAAQREAAKKAEEAAKAHEEEVQRTADAERFRSLYGDKQGYSPEDTEGLADAIIGKSKSLASAESTARQRRSDRESMAAGQIERERKERDRAASQAERVQEDSAQSFAQIARAIDYATDPDSGGPKMTEDQVLADRSTAEIESALKYEKLPKSMRSKLEAEMDRRKGESVNSEKYGAIMDELRTFKSEPTPEQMNAIIVKHFGSIEAYKAYRAGADAR